MTDILKQYPTPWRVVVSETDAEYRVVHDANGKYVPPLEG
jgi:hypothetical protein